VIAIRGQPLDGGHFVIGDIFHDGNAGTDRLALNMHGTGAAKSCTATVLGPSQGEFIAQIPHERHLRIAVVTPLLLVYYDFHLVNPPSSLEFFVCRAYIAPRSNGLPVQI
jgi:hypothetical protein